MRRIGLSFLLILGLLVVPTTGSALGEEQGYVFGTVTDAVTERPVEGICVWVYGPEMTETAYSGFTNWDGVYEIGLPAGEWILEFDDCERHAYDTVQDVVNITVNSEVQVDQFLPLADGILLVVRIGSTPKQEVEEAYAMLESLGGNVLGTCATSVGDA